MLNSHFVNRPISDPGLPHAVRLHVADYGVYPHCQLLIPDDGGVFDPGPFFHGNYIITVGGELLTAVRGNPFPAFFLEGRGKSLGLFSCALFRPGWGDFKSGRPGLELFPVCPTATVYADGVGDQFPVFVASFLNISHVFPFLCKEMANFQLCKVQDFVF